MKIATIASVAVAALALVGCSSSSKGDEGAAKPGSGVALNPSGKPQNAQEATYAAQQQKTGQAMNDQRAKDAAAMAAAKAKAGVK